MNWINEWMLQWYLYGLINWHPSGATSKLIKASLLIAMAWQGVWLKGCAPPFGMALIYILYSQLFHTFTIAPKSYNSAKN